jgi:hypothetical protein
MIGGPGAFALLFTRTAANLYLLIMPITGSIAQTSRWIGRGIRAAGPFVNSGS